MLDTKKTQLFETTPIPQAVMKLAVPTVMATLVMVLYNLADTYFVGRIGSAAETAAVSFAAPVLLAFNAVNNLFGTGTSSLMSRALGKKDYDTAAGAAAFGFYGSLICAILFSLICTLFRPALLNLLGVSADAKEATIRYLFWTVTLGAAPSILNVVLSFQVRAEGASMHASIGSMAGCVLNVLLDPIFIMPWGLNMGAAGAGCATFLSNCVACAYYLVLIAVKGKNTCLTVNPKRLRFNSEIVGGSFIVGIPAAIQNLLNVTGMTILNNLTASAALVFGEASVSPAVAAMGITHKVDMLPMYISMGRGQGIMPLVGYNFASGNAERMKKSITFTVKFMLGFAFAAAAAYFVFSENIISLFMKDSEIVSFGGRFLKGFCLAIPFLSLDFLAVGVFQAVGMGGKSLLFAILRKVALEIPALYLLNHFFPLYGLSYSQLIAEAVLAVLSVFMLRNIFRSVGKK